MPKTLPIPFYPEILPNQEYMIPVDSGHKIYVGWALAQHHPHK